MVVKLQKEQVLSPVITNPYLTPSRGWAVLQMRCTVWSLKQITLGKKAQLASAAKYNLEPQINYSLLRPLVPSAEARYIIPLDVEPFYSYCSIQRFEDRLKDVKCINRRLALIPRFKTKHAL